MVLAALHDYRDKVDAFTYFTNSGTGKWAKAMRMDRDLSRQVLDLADVNHVPIAQGEGAKLTAEDRAIADKNSLGEHGRWLVARYREHFGSVSGIHLRGNTQETIRAYFGSTKSRDPIDLVKGLMKSRLNTMDLADEEMNAYLSKLESTLEQFGYPADLFDYVASDFFYWEVRMGRWLAEIYNETDTAFDSISPMNMRAIVELGLAGAEDERRSGVIFTELIDRNWPELNFPGINNRDNLYRQSRALHKTNKELKAKAAATPSWIGTIAGDQTHPICTAPLTVESSGAIVQAESGEIRIPASELGIGACAHRTFSWPDGPTSVLTFALRGDYVNSRGTDYMRFEVDVNGQTLVGHKVGLDSEVSYWSIYGLEPGDVVSLGVRSLQSVTSESWSRASRVYVSAMNPAFQYWSKLPPRGLGYVTTSVAAVAGSSIAE